MRASQRRRPFRKTRLEAMIAEATVDAYGESEQLGGFYTMIEEHLAVPFETTLLGVPVTVKGVDLTERDEIVAICARRASPARKGDTEDSGAERVSE